MARGCAAAACIASACSAVSAAYAGDRDILAGDWRFSLTPYVWAAAFEGDVAALPPLRTVSVDASFSDILENLDVAAMLAGELRKGRFAVLADFVYTQLSADGSTPGPLFSGVEVESDMAILTGALAYELYSSGRISVDGLAGVRAWWVDTEVTLQGGLLAARQRSFDEAWADGIVGIRMNAELGDGFSLAFRADAGGGASDLTWQLLGSLNYQVNDWLNARVGYRHLDVDYEDDGFVWDINMSGPIVGATIRF
jgi:hypothetical protein